MPGWRACGTEDHVARDAQHERGRARKGVAGHTGLGSARQIVPARSGRRANVSHPDEPRRKRRAPPCGGRPPARARAARTWYRAVWPRSITACTKRGEQWPRWSRSSCLRTYAPAGCATSIRRTTLRAGLRRAPTPVAFRVARSETRDSRHPASTALPRGLFAPGEDDQVRFLQALAPTTDKRAAWSRCYANSRAIRA